MPPGVLSALVIALTVLVVIQGLALLELVRQFAQVRQRLDLGDHPRAYPAPVGMRVSLPDELLSSPIHDALHCAQAALVLLSLSCLTCMSIASSWSRLSHLPRESFVLLPILQARSLQEAKRFIAVTELQENETILDLNGLLSDSIGRQTGLNTRPAVIMLEHGRVWGIEIVRNAQQIVEVIDKMLVREGSSERNGKGTV